MNKHLIKKGKWLEIQRIWSIIAAPGRPSVFDLKIWAKKIQQMLVSKKKLKALVLGATPEIRDLLAKYRIPTTILDINSGMVREMGKLMKYREYRKEKVIINDWLNIDKLFPKGYFDLVLGHGFFNNLPWRFYSKLAQNIRQILKKDGYLLMVTPILGKTKKISPKQVISMFQRNREYFKSFANRWYILDVLKKLDYNKRTKQVFFNKIKERLIQEIKKQNLPKEIIKNIWVFGSFTFLDNYVTTHPPLKELLKILKKYFEVEKMSYGPHLGYKAHPNFILKPKK